MLWVRSQRAAVVDVGDDVVLVGRDVRRLSGDSATLARAVVAYLGVAHCEAEVMAHVETLAGPLGERRAVIGELVALLAETGAITATASAIPDAPRAPDSRGANIVIGASGAIAASHVPAFVTALQRRGHTIEVALTATAQRFVARDALAAIIQREPHTSLWPATAQAPVPHVALARWAELAIIYPASATTIARIANGDFADLVSAVALTTSAPVVIVPSMNQAMLEAPAVQRNLDRLRADGHVIVHGVPSQEVAEAPPVRATIAGAAPGPTELATTLDALLTAGILRRDTTDPVTTWDAAYRSQVAWASETCDADLAATLAAHAPTARRVLDVGCGLGQVARHAAAIGHRVVATDLSAVALALASTTASDIVWLRDDICASALSGTFDIIVDRATLHVLPPARAAAWAATIRRLLAPDGNVIVKCHASGVPGVTIGWSAAALAELTGLEVVSSDPAELPSPTEPTPIPSLLVVLRSRRA